MSAVWRPTAPNTTSCPANFVHAQGVISCLAARRPITDKMCRPTVAVICDVVAFRHFSQALQRPESQHVRVSLVHTKSKNSDLVWK